MPGHLSSIRTPIAPAVRGSVAQGKKIAIQEAQAKVLRREVAWIHTHFLTNCVYLPAHRAHEIQQKMQRVLEEEGIVFGIRFDSQGREEELRIVLECIPLPEPMRRIESALAEIISPIPARPSKTKVRIEPSAKPAAARRQGANRRIRGTVRHVS